ncbi:antibiotic biosynthesis monooxygenase [Paraglaciecola sp. L3A3]|uniref:antibiotic biosynthesis monooxygenase family protein n=1 Tax=Paraglaciecola sp. L3A3 TaxID=2686358 RepID=UPI00131E8984|nr:hypothetical protein [Paraglaciecola sp. L3A3]
MKLMNKLVLSIALLTTPIFAFAEVIEIASFTLNKGVTFQEFAAIDKTVEKEHVKLQPGFISRETAKGENGEWLVVVHWETLKDADASMNSFMQAKAANTFMSKINTSTMNMKRYTK